jgi:hypothetical protein
MYFGGYRAEVLAPTASTRTRHYEIHYRKDAFVLWVGTVENACQGHILLLN